ncbi:MAG: hypothetical protein J6A62_02705 [Oscillospiraceae bacterium]|nr:hypothetical protein [Oscillospiraceae bacterium]
MRLPMNESFFAQMGLTDDHMMLRNLCVGSKGYAGKGSTRAVVLSLTALAALVGFIVWCACAG